jgi:hypothetical protein
VWLLPISSKSHVSDFDLCFQAEHLSVRLGVKEYTICRQSKGVPQYDSKEYAKEAWWKID